MWVCIQVHLLYVFMQYTVGVAALCKKGFVEVTYKSVGYDD